MKERIAKVVVAVARMGETDLWGWWSTRGLTGAGEYVLGSTWGRTWVWSALEADVLCAQRKHEEVFDRHTAVHLFSHALPAKQWALGWLREQKMLSHVDEFADRVRRWSKETAVAELARLCGVKPPEGEILAGVRRLGTVTASQIADQSRCYELVLQLAAAYGDRPSQKLLIPYFDLV